MLNLLIAVISETYDRVMENLVPFEYQERCNLMAEVEEMMFWKRESGSCKYIHVALYEQESEIETEGNQINSKFLKIKS